MAFARRHVHPHPRTVRHAIRRRTEDVDYWRKRSGWFDDDVAMKEYNDGVYDTYYQLDDDRTHRSRSSFSGGANSDLVKNSLKVLSVLIVFGLCFLMFRILNRRWGGESKKKRTPSTGRSERSSSRTRSRSRSRRGEYDLMAEEHDKPHRSKSGRSRSRTRARSRSASRRDATEKTAPPAPTEAVLV